MIPGFSVIKNRIITPLLVASEKVVEYMIPEIKSNSKSLRSDGSEESKEKNAEESEENDRHCINFKFQRLSLEDIERNKRKRVFKTLEKTNQNINIPKSLINKASD